MAALRLAMAPGVLTNTFLLSFMALRNMAAVCGRWADASKDGSQPAGGSRLVLLSKRQARTAACSDNC